jgi:hypothetical protein
MLKRAIVIGLLVGAPLAAMAQQADHPNSGARLISPLPPQAPTPPIAAPAIAKDEPDNAAPSRAEKSVPPTPVDSRGTEQSPLAVQIIPTSKTAADFAQDAASRQEKASSDLWLMLLTAAVAGTALLQLIALIVLIGTTRRQQRAYVFVSGAEIVDLEIGGAPIAQIEIKNTGQTPAYALTHVWRCGIFDYPLQQKLLLPHSNDPVSWPHLGPGASAKAQRAAEKQLASGGQTEFINRATAFYVYGELLYRDAFNKPRFTRYVFFHTGLPRMGPGQLVAYEKGNEAS